MLRKPSISEDNGINFLTKSDRKVYSVGISTGGVAEMRMAIDNPERCIIATTIDPTGVSFAQNQIEQNGLSKQIQVKLEDVSNKLPYADGYFDYIYARLVLHYLTKQDLQHALRELYRILKIGGKIFAVVRSTECIEAQDRNASFDPQTSLTTYSSNGNNYSRYFHSKESIKDHLLSSGFAISHTSSYQEQLCVDFQRTTLSKNIDSLIEVLAFK